MRISLYLLGALYLSASHWAPVHAVEAFPPPKAHRLVQRASTDAVPQFSPVQSAVRQSGTPPSGGGSNPLTSISASWEGIPSDFTLEPPDPSGAVGPNGVLATVNLRLAYYDKSGNAIWGPIDHTTFFSGVGIQGTNILSDPH